MPCLLTPQDAAEYNGTATTTGRVISSPSAVVGAKSVVNPLESFALASVAACGAVTLTNPLDVVKTRLVLQGQLQKQAKAFFVGPVHALRMILIHEGPAALLKGLVPAYATQVFMNGTRFGLYPTFKRNVRQCAPPSVPDVFVDMVSGCVGPLPTRRYHCSSTPVLPHACMSCVILHYFPHRPMRVARVGVGVIGAAIGSPFQMIKIRMQSYSSSSATMAVAEQHKYKSLFHGLATVLKEEGVAGWRRAMDACMVKVALASAVQLSVYDHAKGRLQRSNEWKQRFGATETHIAASLAASLAVVSAINPLEVVNTRLYNQKGEKYKGVTDCFVKTIASEGPTGLYKGFSAHFMRVAPHTILTFVFLEALQRNVEARRCAAMPSHPE